MPEFKTHADALALLQVLSQYRIVVLRPSAPPAIRELVAALELPVDRPFMVPIDKDARETRGTIVTIHELSALPGVHEFVVRHVHRMDLPVMTIRLDISAVGIEMAELDSRLAETSHG